MIIPIGTSRIHEPMELLPSDESSFLNCGYFHSSGQVLDLLRILTGEIELSSEKSKWFFRRDQTPSNPFDVRLWSQYELSEAIMSMRQLWDESSACIIEICTPRTYILDGLNIQGNPNAERNVSYADVWKNGYYVSYEPELEVKAIDESTDTISDNIAEICRILDRHNRSGLFLGHLVNPAKPHPVRALNNENLESAFKSSSFGSVKYFDTGSIVEMYGFRILDDGNQDIHHLPLEGLGPLAELFSHEINNLVHQVD